MKNIEEVPWAALYAELWPEAWRRREISIEAMEASVGDRVRHLGAGEISRALQSIAERQRSGDKGTPAGPPSANRLVSEIIRARFVARRPPDECQTRIEATRAERQARLRDAPDHQTRWDIICEARDPAECMALHRWTCAEWPDFPATVVDVPDAWRGNVKALLADALVEQAAVEAGLAAEEYAHADGLRASSNTVRRDVRQGGPQ
jgi:hypothetical protein